ncbi:glycoside hydrolase family 18 protein [Wolfiporia cocos MD-104 SS10]|uniref:Glycoside hydrolase family 18 protein n=1 Tax=Wolfiporia cocos (strain MD-104) TaxID=742152 RepID=A0A2H3JVK1_WOLCO|nr:glycoside hydrolase family 18 protein [Wolfiporia cocos MD-104 SS10]
MQAQHVFKAQANRCIAAAYYPYWAGGSSPPQNIDFSRFDIIYFAFATVNSSFTIDFDGGSTSTPQTLVSSAHNSGHGTKVVLSIGGWDGSYWFSQAVSSATNRSTFVNACINAVNTYNLDGIDIDWEYPADTGAGNPNSPSDSANLLSFFTELRHALGGGKIISAAVNDVPWMGSNGSSLTDVSAYAKVMTYANIMNYDVFGASSSSPGPNAPLGNLCNNSLQPQYSAEAAVAQWTSAGFPANQLVLGLPLYGYVSQSAKTTLQDFREPKGTVVEQDKAKVDEEGTPNPLRGAHPQKRLRQDIRRTSTVGDLSSYWGQAIAFNQIVELGALKQSGGVFVADNGYTEGWDNCSDTPYLFNAARTTVVTYDDTYSLGDKASYAKSAELAGCFTWSLIQDHNYVLQDAIRSNLGLS